MLNFENMLNEVKIVRERERERERDAFISASNVNQKSFVHFQFITANSLKVAARAVKKDYLHRSIDRQQSQ